MIWDFLRFNAHLLHSVFVWCFPWDGSGKQSGFRAICFFDAFLLLDDILPRLFARFWGLVDVCLLALALSLLMI